MTAWVPLIKSRKAASVEFTELAPFCEIPEFRGLSELNRLPQAGPAEAAGKSEPPASPTPPRQSESVGGKVASAEAREALLNAEVSRLNVEIERTAKAHEAKLAAVEDELAEKLSTSLFRAHQAALEEMKDTLAECTAKVLRPILSTAATDAAIRDFKSIIGELQADKDAATFTIKASEACLRRLRDLLPPETIAIAASTGEAGITIITGKAIISSRLEEWSASILGAPFE